MLLLIQYTLIFASVLALVALGGCFAAFFADQISERIEHILEGFLAAGNDADFPDLGNLQILAELIFGNAAEHQNALCDFIDFFGGIVVELFELAVKLEERVSLDVPMEAAQIGVSGFDSACSTGSSE